MNKYHQAIFHFFATIKFIFVALFILALSGCGYKGAYWGPTDVKDFDDFGSGVLIVDKATGGNRHLSQQRFNLLKERGTLIVIDGWCMSACTMLLYPEYDNVCWTDDAVFHFHGVSLPAKYGNGVRVTYPTGTFAMWKPFPQYIKDILPPPDEWSHKVWNRVYVKNTAALKEDRHCHNSARFNSLLQAKYTDSGSISHLYGR